MWGPEPRGLGQYPGWKEQVRRPWAAPVGIWMTLRDVLAVGAGGEGTSLGLLKGPSGME